MWLLRHLSNYAAFITKYIQCYLGSHSCRYPARSLHIVVPTPRVIESLLFEWSQLSSQEIQKKSKPQSRSSIIQSRPFQIIQTKTTLQYIWNGPSWKERNFKESWCCSSVLSRSCLKVVKSSMLWSGLQHQRVREPHQRVGHHHQRRDHPDLHLWLWLRARSLWSL